MIAPDDFAHELRELERAAADAAAAVERGDGAPILILPHFRDELRVMAALLHAVAEQCANDVDRARQGNAP